MKKPKTKALRELADMVEEWSRQPKHVFDMCVFGEKRECGTACCALGLAASQRRFGLRMNWKHIPTVVHVATEADSEDAACPAFGISFDEAYALFMPGGYRRSLYSRKIDGMAQLADESTISPARVAHRLRYFADKFDKDKRWDGAQWIKAVVDTLSPERSLT